MLQMCQHTYRRELKEVSVFRKVHLRRKEKNRACEKGDTGHNALNAPFNKIQRNY